MNISKYEPLLYLYLTYEQIADFHTSIRNYQTSNTSNLLVNTCKNVSYLYFCKMLFKSKA